jgi:hypothetical protein
MDAATHVNYTYELREALGFGKLYSLNNLITDASNMRKALVACAPIAHAAITASGGNDRLGYIGGTGHPSPDEPITVTITTTVGALREARRALFVIALEPPRAKENGCSNG